MRFVFSLMWVMVCAVALDAKSLSVPVACEGAILINGKTGAVLYSKNAHTPGYPASITKIATVLYAIKMYKNRLDERVEAKQEAIASISTSAKRQSNYRSPAYWLETNSCHVGIKRGEEFALRDLLYLTLVASANDAANVVAQHVGGTIPKFMERLNAYLKEIGCKDTYFMNPHGLHHPDHKTTAFDMALIARHAMQEPIFREICKTVRYVCPETNLQPERAVLQTNLLLRKGAYHYDKAIGIKTGWNSDAGKSLVGAAEDGDRFLIAVVLGGATNQERFGDCIKMFDAAFQEPKMRKTLLKEGPQTLTTSIAGAREKISTTLPTGLYYDFYPSEDVPVKARVSWQIPSLPIASGTRVGTVRIVDNQGTILQETPLLAADEVHPSSWYRFKAFFGNEERMRKVLFFVVVGTALLALFFIRHRRKRKSSKKIFF